MPEQTTLKKLKQEFIAAAAMLAVVGIGAYPIAWFGG
jgi:hypothetical protein